MTRVLTHSAAPPSLALCLCLTLAVAPGCLPTSSSPAIPSDAAVDDRSRTSRAADDAPRSALRIADGAAFQELLQSKRGQVILVDCWATWCVACRQQFPHTVELHREFAKAGLAVISFSFDDPNDAAALGDVRGFLTEQGAAFDNLVSWQGASEAAFEALGIDNGALPHYQLYDRQGQLVRKFNSGDPQGKPFTPADIRQAIVAQLADEPLPPAAQSDPPPP